MAISFFIIIKRVASNFWVAISFAGKFLLGGNNYYYYYYYYNYFVIIILL